MLGSPTPLSFSLQTSWRKWWRSLRGSFMMKPFMKLYPRRSLSISLRKSFIFSSSSRSSSSSSIMIIIIHLRGSLPSVWWLPCCHPPSFLPLLPPKNGEEILEVSRLSHSRRWEVYSGGICVLGSPSAPTSELSRYSGMATETISSPPTCVAGTSGTSYCSPGSVRVLTLQEEVSKMLLNGALELVNQPGPGFYS